MIKNLALLAASAILISGTYSAPAPVASPAVDALAMLKQSVNDLGKDAQHPYVIPYCGAEPILISTENAGFLPKSDEAGKFAPLFRPS